LGLDLGARVVVYTKTMPFLGERRKMQDNINQPLPMASGSNLMPNNKTKNKLLPAVIILAVLLCGTAIGLICVFLQLKNSNDELQSLKSEYIKMEELLNEKTDDRYVAGDDEQVVVDDPSGSSGESTPNSTAQIYLEPTGWDVKFAYPEGVTKIEYTMSDNFDGTIYIDSITKNGKKYDVNICGGSERYVHYPFFLGRIARWTPTAQHETWDTSPAIQDDDLLLKVSNNEYYGNFEHTGNGCESSDATALSDYEEALEIVRELYRGVVAK